MKHWPRLLSVALSLFALACQPTGGGKDRPLVVVTTTMLGDATATIAGDEVEVFTIMKPGGDPHLYQPTPSDVMRVGRASLVITNGLHLEGWIDKLLANAGGSRPTVVASDGIEPRQSAAAPGGVDPHFWFDVASFAQGTRNIETALIPLVPSNRAPELRARAQSYRTRLEELDRWTRASVATIAPQHRVLITSHDAFGYFGRAYGMEVRGIQGVSTEHQAAQRDVIDTIERVNALKLPAVFVESSVNPGLVEQVGRETSARVLGPLYSDSVGPPGSGADTYEGMVRSNVTQIVEGLGGRPSAEGHAL